MDFADIFRRALKDRAPDEYRQLQRTGQLVSVSQAIAAEARANLESLAEASNIPPDDINGRRMMQEVVLHEMLQQYAPDDYEREPDSTSFEAALPTSRPAELPPRPEPAPAATPSVVASPPLSRRQQRLQDRAITRAFVEANAAVPSHGPEGPRGRGFWRAAVGAIAAPLAVWMLMMILGVIVDTVWGGLIIDGRWRLDIPDVCVWLLGGWLVGYLAGWAAPRRPRLAAIIAMVWPGLFAAVAVTVKHLDPAAFQSGLDYNRFALTVGLIPAILAAPLAARTQPNGPGGPVGATGGLILFGTNLAGLALHLWTTALAFGLTGPVGVIGTFTTPVLAEIYWMIEGWWRHRPFAPLLTWRIAVYLAGLVLGAALFAWGMWLDKQQAAAAAREEAAPA